MKISIYKSAVLFLCFFNLWCINSVAQQLLPGFNKGEYIELMKLSARTTASPAYYNTMPAPERFTMLYQSPVIGLDNLWDLWMDKNKVAVISIRGTTAKPESWLGNFYAAMVPAKGALQLGENDVFTYQLAENPRAAVHVGWLVSAAFLSKDMLPKIDSCYKAGVKNMIVMGHSQGGAIAFLLTAYLNSLQQQNILPADIRFKTYCSAAPKPGNVYFAYEYEAMTQAGWAYNVVNAADWVPETPMSIQTTDDYNITNPFVNAKDMIKKQKFPKNIALKHVYNRLDKPTKAARKRYQNYLGKMVAKAVKKQVPGFMPPAYYNSNHYVRTGNTIVLLPDADYFKLFPESRNNFFAHHFHPPYLYLAEKLP
jgi:hypothetical protein